MRYFEKRHRGTHATSYLSSDYLCEVLEERRYLSQSLPYRIVGDFSNAYTYNVSQIVHFGGTVVDGVGNPVPGVHVGVDDGLKNVCAVPITTDNAGRFTYDTVAYTANQARAGTSILTFDARDGLNEVANTVATYCVKDPQTQSYPLGLQLSIGPQQPGEVDPTTLVFSAKADGGLVAGSTPRQLADAGHVLGSALLTWGVDQISDVFGDVANVVSLHSAITGPLSNVARSQAYADFASGVALGSAVTVAEAIIDAIPDSAISPATKNSFKDGLHLGSAFVTVTEIAEVLGPVAAVGALSLAFFSIGPIHEADEAQWDVGSDTGQYDLIATNTTGDLACVITVTRRAAATGQPPTAQISFPVNGSAVSQSVVNTSPRYIDVAFSASGGSGLNASSIVDSTPEFQLTGAAAGGVSIAAVPTLVGGTTYRYALSGGGFDIGTVGVYFLPGSWSDNSGRVNLSMTDQFTVVPDATGISVSPSTLLPLPLPQTQLLTINGSGFTSLSTLTFWDTFGNSYAGKTPIFISSTQLQYNVKVGTDQGEWKVAVVNGGLPSNQAFFYVTNASPVVTPTISPAGGNYTGAIEVSLSTATSGATLRYTLDGSDPTVNSALYSGPFTLSSSATVKSRGFKAGLPDSAVASASYIIAAPTQVATPVMSPNGGTFSPSVQVSISIATPGAQIIYTTDGRDPTLGGIVYTGPFTLTEYSTVRAYARKAGLTDSAVNNVAFFVSGPQTPVLAVSATELNVGSNSGQYLIRVSNAGGGTVSYHTEFPTEYLSWMYAGANDSSSGPTDFKNIWVNVDRNDTGTSRTGMFTIGSNAGRIDIHVTQSPSPAMDVAADAIILTADPYDTTPISSPQVGQQVYFRYNTIWTGIAQRLGWLYPFPDRSPHFTVRIDGVLFTDGTAGGEVPLNWLLPGDKPWTVTAGTHTVDVDLDTTNSLPETNESNNHSSFTFTAAPAVNISGNGLSIAEGNTGTNDAVFTVSLSRSSTLATTVNFATADGTATAGVDYVATAGTLTFAPGETTKTVVVPIFGDNTVEPDETFTLNLSNPSNAVIASGQLAGTILADDLPAGATAAANSRWSLTGAPNALTLSVSAGEVVLASDLAASFSNMSLNVTGGAVVSVWAMQHLAALQITDGLVDLAPGGGHSLSIGQLSIGATGKLDIADNALLLKGTTTAAVQALVVLGFDHGTWLGTHGISSSAAAADAGGRTAVGFVSNGDLGRTSFAGFSGLTSTDVLVKYTYYGDTDLNGKVTLDDFSLFLHGYQTGGTGWLYGDLDFNGKVTLDDFSLFLAGYQRQGAPL